MSNIYYERIKEQAYQRVIDLDGETTEGDVKEYLGNYYGDFPEFDVACAEGCAAAFAECASTSTNQD